MGASRHLRAALAAVARHCSAVAVPGADPSAATLKFPDGARIALTIAELPVGAGIMRLRFDRVAVGLVGRLQAALGGLVPDGATLLATVTAPIRQDAKTCAALGEIAREKIAGMKHGAVVARSILGNQTTLRVLPVAVRGRPVLGFVHNPTSDAEGLAGMVGAVIAGWSATGRRVRGRRWLVLVCSEDVAPVVACRQMIAHAGFAHGPERVLLVGVDGGVEEVG